MENIRFADDVHEWIIKVCKSIDTWNARGLQYILKWYDGDMPRSIAKFNEWPRITSQRLYNILSWENTIRVDMNVYSKYESLKSIDEKDLIPTHRCFLYTPYSEVKSILQSYIDEYIPNNPTNHY